jgi:hypothetical protein
LAFSSLCKRTRHKKWAPCAHFAKQVKCGEKIVAPSRRYLTPPSTPSLELSDNRQMAEVAGYWLVAVAAIHLLASLRWRERGGLRRRVSPPWEGDDLRRQRDFWSQIGSFALPLGLLGGLIAWLAHRGSEPPLWVGVLLLAWLVAAIARLPRGGFWLGIVPAVLLILDRLT